MRRPSETREEGPRSPPAPLPRASVPAAGHPASREVAAAAPSPTGQAESPSSSEDTLVFTPPLHEDIGVAHKVSSLSGGENRPRSKIKADLARQCVYMLCCLPNQKEAIFPATNALFHVKIFKKANSVISRTFVMLNAHQNVN